MIQVSGPEGDKTKPAELIDPSVIGLPTKYWILFSVLGLGVILGLGYFIRKALKGRKKPNAPLPKIQLDPPHVMAMKKIDALYRKYTYDRENLKPVSFGVSEILKEFFSERFKVDAREATSDEMIELLRREAIQGENLREIQLLFSDLDLVKFTKNESYSHFDEDKYNEFKVKANLIIQKWALRVHSSEVKP